MARRLAFSCLAMFVGGWLHVAHAQTIFSPSQADYLNLAFADFIDNEAPDMAALNSLTAVTDPEVGNAVEIDFTTDFDTNDALWRVAMEVPYDSQTMTGAFSADLTGLDAFQVTVSNPMIAPAGIPSITAQLYVRSANNQAFTGSNGVAVGSSGTTTLSISTDAITASGGDISDITTFGLEFFGGDEFLGGLDGATVLASTTPEPPTLADTTLFSWENGADLQGWDSPPIVAGAHTLQVRQGSPAVGATDGNNALQVTRHPTANFFEWGSAYTLDAFADSDATGDYNNDGSVNLPDYTVWRDNLGSDGTALSNRDLAHTGPVGIDDYDAWKSRFGSTAGGDPGIQAEIDSLVDLFNDPDSYSIAFDVTIEDQFPNDNPSYLILHMAVAADGGPDNAGDPFFQNNNGLIPGTAIGSGEPVTVEMLLSQFVDVAGGSDTNGMSLSDVGLDPTTGFLTFHLASNLGLAGGAMIANDVTFTIDNFRIRQIVPDGAALTAQAVPEPASAVLVAIGAAAGILGRRKVRIVRIGT
jgi:hypothetical protein